MASVELDLSKLMGFRIIESETDVKRGDEPVVLGSKVGDKIGSKLGVKDAGPSKAVLSMKIGVKDGAKTD